MCKHMASLVIAFVLVSTALAGPRDTNTSRVASRVLPGIVRIARPGEGGMDVIGTGICVDRRGYILTCQHVVSGEPELLVGLYGKKEWHEAQVKFADKGNDIAVIKIDARVPELQLGPSSDLKVGEPAIVIGDPLAQTFTVTQGIISKLRVLNVRLNEKKEPVRRYLIQTDAAINPGNSGGALLNALGEVVGVVELKERGSEALGFAITADRAQRIIAEAMSAEEVAGVEHGVAGLEMHVLSHDGKGRERQSVVVSKLVENGPARGVLHVGDRVLEVGKFSIVNQFDFERAFWDRKPGDEVKLTIVRDGKKMNVIITLAGDGIVPEHID